MVINCIIDRLGRSMINTLNTVIMLKVRDLEPGERQKGIPPKVQEETIIKIPFKEIRRTRQERNIEDSQSRGIRYKLVAIHKASKTA